MFLGFWRGCRSQFKYIIYGFLFVVSIVLKVVVLCIFFFCSFNLFLERLRFVLVVVILVIILIGWMVVIFQFCWRFWFESDVSNVEQDSFIEFYVIILELRFCLNWQSEMGRRFFLLFFEILGYGEEEDVEIQLLFSCKELGDVSVQEDKGGYGDDLYVVLYRNQVLLLYEVDSEDDENIFD